MDVPREAIALFVAVFITLIVIAVVHESQKVLECPSEKRSYVRVCCRAKGLVVVTVNVISFVLKNSAIMRVTAPVTAFAPEL